MINVRFHTEADQELIEAPIAGLPACYLLSVTCHLPPAVRCPPSAVLSSPPMDERIGPYRILRKLGEGGMGVVYAAEDERLRRAVAIKTIRDAGDSSARERFFREARAAASVSHPSVRPLFDIGEESGRPFLLMELLDGEPLSDRVRRGALPLN